jgi:hypothetical protein
MTPQEIHDYKMRWVPGYSVRLHSDLTDTGKAWCRRNLERHEWSFTAWTHVYEHTFHFEKESSAIKFKTEFDFFADQERI